MQNRPLSPSVCVLMFSVWLEIEGIGSGRKKEKRHVFFHCLAFALNDFLSEEIRHCTRLSERLRCSVVIGAHLWQRSVDRAVPDSRHLRSGETDLDGADQSLALSSLRREETERVPALLAQSLRRQTRGEVGSGACSADRGVPRGEKRR